MPTTARIHRCVGCTHEAAAQQELDHLLRRLARLPNGDHHKLLRVVCQRTRALVRVFMEPGRKDPGESQESTSVAPIDEELTATRRLLDTLSESLGSRADGAEIAVEFYDSLRVLIGQFEQTVGYVEHIESVKAQLRARRPIGR